MRTTKTMDVKVVRLPGLVPEGARDICQCCGRTVWLRYHSTVVIGEHPTGSRRYKWRPRVGTRSLTQCPKPRRPNVAEPCQPLGQPAVYVLLPIPATTTPASVSISIT
jgi:hypothetical protein